MQLGIVDTTKNNDGQTEVWILHVPGGAEVHTKETALYRFAQIAYEGGLPGTSADRWVLTGDGTWMKDSTWED